MLGIFSVRSQQIRCHSQRSIQEIIYSTSSLAQQFYEHLQFCKLGYELNKHFNSTWIHITPRIQKRAFSTTRKLTPQLNEQWLQYMQDRQLLRCNLIVLKDWLASKVVYSENLLAQTISSFDSNKFQNRG